MSRVTYTQLLKIFFSYQFLSKAVSKKDSESFSHEGISTPNPWELFTADEQQPFCTERTTCGLVLLNLQRGGRGGGRRREGEEEVEEEEEEEVEEEEEEDEEEKEKEEEEEDATECTCSRQLSSTDSQCLH